MGDEETCTPVYEESTLGYHSCLIEVLTYTHELGEGPCQAGSLTGAVASKSVTEALKGLLSTDGNRAFECKRRSEPDCEGDGPSRNESWS